MDFDQLAEAANFSGRRKVSAVGGKGDLPHVYVSVRIDCYAVRRDKLSGALSTPHIAQSSETVAVEIVNSDAAADVGIVSVHLKLGRNLTNIDQVVFDVQSTGAMQIVPLV